MTTMYPHPFLKHPEPRDPPEDKRKLINQFYEWIKDQPRFPKYSWNHAYLFLHACLWDLDAARSAIKRYGQIKAEAIDIFDERDLLDEGIKQAFECTNMLQLPKLTPEGYRIALFKLTNFDPAAMNFKDMIKAFCMISDTLISENGPEEGYAVVFDMTGLKLGHLARIKLGILRDFMTYIQEAHPIRLKRVHVVNTVPFINQLMAIVKPFIQAELLKILHFTTQGPDELFGPEYLPEEYGGDLPSSEKYHNEWQAKMNKEYREWLLDSSNLKAEKKCSSSPPRETFRTLDID